MRAFGIIRNCLAVIGVVWLCAPIYREVRDAMTLSFPWVWQEKGRVKSPSGVCEFVTYEGNRGAMSCFAYACFLVKPGKKVDPNAMDANGSHGGELVLSSSHNLPKAQWKDGGHLAVDTEGGYVNSERPYSREFKVAIEFHSEPPAAE